MQTKDLSRIDGREVSSQQQVPILSKLIQVLHLLQAQVVLLSPTHRERSNLSTSIESSIHLMVKLRFTLLLPSLSLADSWKVSCSSHLIQSKFASNPLSLAFKPLRIQCHDSSLWPNLKWKVLHYGNSSW